VPSFPPLFVFPYASSRSYAFDFNCLSSLTTLPSCSPTSASPALPHLFHRLGNTPPPTALLHRFRPLIRESQTPYPPNGLKKKIFQTLQRDFTQWLTSTGSGFPFFSFSLRGPVFLLWRPPNLLFFCLLSCFHAFSVTDAFCFLFFDKFSSSNRCPSSFVGFFFLFQGVGAVLFFNLPPLNLFLS